MSYFVREVDLARWAEPIASKKTHPDLLADLLTKDGKISVWELDSNQDNLPRIAAALASRFSKIKPLNCIIFPKTNLSEAGIEFVQCPGVTADTMVNNLHFDILTRSPYELISLATVMVQSGIPKTFQDNLLFSLVENGLYKSEIDVEKVKIDDSKIYKRWIKNRKNYENG